MIGHEVQLKAYSAYELILLTLLMKLTIYTDGGARGNPGPAATGIVIKDEQGKVLAAYGEYLGKQTNNVAEYAAIISGLKKAHAEALKAAILQKVKENPIEDSQSGL